MPQVGEHQYGEHSNGGQDYTLLYTQRQMDAMVARATSVERERCAKILDAALAEERTFASSKDRELSESASHTVTALELLVSRIRSGE